MAEIYKNFDIEGFSEPDKAKAIINFLKIDGENDTIEENIKKAIINFFRFEEVKENCI